MAVAASLQMGLFTETNRISEADRAQRGSVAAALFIMDTYVTTALGLPRTLRDINLECVVPDLGRPYKAHQPNFGTLAHACLARILADIVENNHSVTRQIPHRNGFYGVPYKNIAVAENKLQHWFECLDRTPAPEQNLTDTFLR